MSAKEARSGLIRGTRSGEWKNHRNNRSCAGLVVTTQMIDDEMEEGIGKNRRQRLGIAVRNAVSLVATFKILLPNPPAIN